MSKPEYWWCVKAEGRFQAFTASLNKFSPIAIWLGYVGHEKLRIGESIVRIRVVEEVKGAEDE